MRITNSEIRARQIVVAGQAVAIQQKVIAAVGAELAKGKPDRVAKLTAELVHQCDVLVGIEERLAGWLAEDET